MSKRPLEIRKGLDLQPAKSTQKTKEIRITNSPEKKRYG